ncbi:MAG: hypothetical protein WBG02_08705 [Candidatus Acidiferrum sp.]
MSQGPPAFPVLRWFGLFWMVVWLPAYFRVWGWSNLLHLCDVAVILAFVGIWLANPLLLSSQAVAALAPGALWILDVGWRVFSGRFLIGGTDYMWDAHYPLWVRLLSTFHVGLPLVLLWTLRRVGYDRRGFGLQTGIAAVLLIGSRLLPEELNMNYAFRDPLFHRVWGSPPLHLAVIFIPLVVLIYWPTHLLLQNLYPLESKAEYVSPAFDGPLL